MIVVPLAILTKTVETFVKMRLTELLKRNRLIVNLYIYLYDILF